MLTTRKRKLLLGFFTLLVLAVTVWMIYDNSNLKVTEYSIRHSDLPANFDGFRIVQISDLHNTEFGHNNQKLIAAIENIKPDIIVITGDIADSYATDYQVSITFAAQAAKIAPTYYITGNHEARISESGKLFGGLVSNGVTVLSDETVLLEKDSQTIFLSGIQDPCFRSGSSAESTKNILNALQMDKDSFHILLSHRPELFNIYADAQADLVFTGHAHGGQFRLPFIGGLFAPNQGFFPAYDAGIFQSDNCFMVVSRGLGNSIFPLRINNPPEIVVVELKSDN